MINLSSINLAGAGGTGGGGGAQAATFPDVTIYGQPTINGAQIGNFSAQNYLQLPFVVDFAGRPWQIDFAFTTGADVQTQQNILDSRFGLAFAIAQSKLEIALSSNGTSWNLGAHFGTMAITPETSYKVRMTFDGAQYEVKVSANGSDYVSDIVVTSTESLAPKQMLIGVSPDGSHAFGGSVNLAHATLIISGKPVWQGMTEVGNATRMALDMSNIDAEGKQRVKDIVQPELDTLSQKVGGVETNVGDKTQLKTQDKTNLVGAINEIATSGVQAPDLEARAQINRINGIMGPYSDREPIVLTLEENGKAINRAGVKVDKPGWAICSFVGKKGDVYSFNPGVMDGDVCIFSEEITKKESRPIEYKYIYNEDGLPLTATAAYNGQVHSYTWSYEYDEEDNVISETITDDQSGATINALPYQYLAVVGTYHPLTVLNENAELPLDKHCRLISHFQGEGTIRVTVSFNVASADMNLLVFRDGLIANLATQLGTIFQMISETNKALALVEQLAAENSELIAHVRQSTDNPDFHTLPTLCGQPMTLFGAGTPQEAIVPTNWKQYNPVTGEGYQWNGLPSALGQVYINTAVSTNGRYTAVENGYGNLKWVNF